MYCSTKPAIWFCRRTMILQPEKRGSILLTKSRQALTVWSSVRSTASEPKRRATKVPFFSKHVRTRSLNSFPLAFKKRSFMSPLVAAEKSPVFTWYLVKPVYSSRPDVPSGMSVTSASIPPSAAQIEPGTDTRAGPIPKAEASAHNNWRSTETAASEVSSPRRLGSMLPRNLI